MKTRITATLALTGDSALAQTTADAIRAAVTQGRKQGLVVEMDFASEPIRRQRKVTNGVAPAATDDGIPF